MANIVQTEANNLLTGSLKPTGFVPVSTQTNLRLMTTVPTNVAAGTEVTGGSYAALRLDNQLGTAASGAMTNTGALTYTNMPDTSGAGGVKAIEVWDTNATPTRRWFGNLTTTKTTALGDTLSFAIGSINFTLG